MKKLEKIINKSIKASFKDNRLFEPKVVRLIKYFKSLPSQQSIYALSEYLKGIKRIERARTMIIETSHPLSLGQVQGIKRIVSKKYGINKLESQINPNILGGFKIKIGDEVIDETIQNKINQVKEVISGRSSSSN